MAKTKEWIKLKGMKYARDIMEVAIFFWKTLQRIYGITIMFFGVVFLVIITPGSRMYQMFFGDVGQEVAIALLIADGGFGKYTKSGIFLAVSLVIADISLKVLRGRYVHIPGIFGVCVALLLANFGGTRYGVNGIFVTYFVSTVLALVLELLTRDTGRNQYIGCIPYGIAILTLKNDDGGADE